MRHVVRMHRANHGTHFRALGLRGAAQLVNPFLGVDHAWMSGPTFPPHPHAGFSAVSYLFLDSETGIANQDSIGNKNLIPPGGLHWAAAGKGIVHEEVPAEQGKMVHSLHIFVNLPAELRTAEPFALTLAPNDIPVVQRPGVKVRVPVGRFGDAVSPLTPPTAVTLLDMTMAQDAAMDLPVPAGETLFVMPIFGTVEVDGEPYDIDGLNVPVFIAEDAPRVLSLRSPRGPAKAMVFSGAPLPPNLV